MKLPKKATPGSGKIIVGDCKNILKVLPEGCADAVITDPPFNIGVEYDNHDDRMTRDQFLAWLGRRVRRACKVLKPNGSFLMFMGPQYQADAFCLLRNAGLHFRNSIVWHYTFGQNQKRKFTPSWTMIHYFVRDPKRFTFNADAVKVPSARQEVYNDKRAKNGGKVPNDTWVLRPDQHPEFFRADHDAWLVSRVCGTFNEKVPHVNQLPLAVVERLIRAATNPGDLVVDPFAGTGTVLVAAGNLGRRSLGIEISPETAEVARGRLAHAAEAADETGVAVEKAVMKRKG